jgi:GNAT superfamily N-acetyltransferase
MSAPLTIRKVENACDFRAFFEFPWQLYKNDPNWVPPLKSMRRGLLDKASNPDWKYLEGEYFAAWRGNQMVGTIAAFINHRHNQTNHEHIGWFGAFEVYEDPDAALALLNTATDWVERRGYDAIVGPETFSAHGECGVLVDGFERPVLLMPYNYPYYRRLVENAGFQKKEDLFSFRLGKSQALQIGLDKHLRERIEAMTGRHQIIVRPIDRRHLRDEFELFKELYQSTFSDTWGYFPITPAELNNMVAMLGRYFDPDFAFFAYAKGEPAGFIMGIPDFNQVLQKAQPHPRVPEFITMLRALWYWKISPTMDCVRVALLGVKPSHRRHGVAAALYGNLLEAFLKSTNIERADCGWISETNDRMIAVIRSVGLECYKTHRLYQKRFAPSPDTAI